MHVFCKYRTIICVQILRFFQSNDCSVCKCSRASFVHRKRFQIENKYLFQFSYVFVRPLFSITITHYNIYDYVPFPVNLEWTELVLL